MNKTFRVLWIFAILSCHGITKAWAATVSYTANTSTDINNPERGWYVAMYYYGHGISNNDTLSATNFQSMVSASNNYSGDTNITMVKRIYDFGGIYGGPNYTNQALDSNVLADITADFNTARSMGIKLILRFDYNEGQGGYTDAPESIILNHISQLTPILQANEDVIAYQEAGFIGEWGEWHDSTNGLTDPSNNNIVTPESDILSAILTALPTDRMVAVRYPGYTLEIFNTTTPITAAQAFSGSNYARCGTHDDCFESDQYDSGTYAKGTNLGWTAAQFKTFLGSQNFSVQEGGETCGTSSYSVCSTSVSDLQNEHWSAMHCQYDQTNIQEWISGGCINQIDMGLGYRYTLDQSTVPASAISGGSLAISFEITNNGWANCYNPRGLELILRPQGQSGTGTAIAVSESSSLNTDPRFWQSGQTYTVNLNLTVPSSLSAGIYDVLLNLPDSKPTLYGTPAYSIQLANQGIWETATGYNELNQSITITVCSGCSPTFTPSPNLTATLTPSVSKTVTLTSTPSSSPSPSSSPTRSDTPSASPTISPSASLSGSPTLSRTPSESPSVTASSTPSISATLTPTSPLSPTVSATSTSILTATPSWTPTSSVTISMTLTVTPSPTISSSPTATPSQSPASSNTASATVTPDIIHSPSPSATVVLSIAPPTLLSNDGRVISSLSALNPQSGPDFQIAVELSGPSAAITLRIYSRGMTAIKEAEILGFWHAGWNRVTLSVPGLANGLYFVVVRAAGDAAYGHKPLYLMVIR